MAFLLPEVPAHEHAYGLHLFKLWKRKNVGLVLEKVIRYKKYTYRLHQLW